MPIYDFQCDKCEFIEERILPIEECDREWQCSCGGVLKRIMTSSGQYCGNEDAAWLKTVPEVINKDTDNPVAKEFIKNPTRSNYKAWMKSEGLRPLENNEPRKPPPTNISKIQKEVWHKFQKRHRIEI